MKRWLFLMSILVCLSGCAHKVEISQLGVVSGFGVDKTETGYRVTAQIVNPSSVAGNHPDTLPIYSISAEGVTLFDAYRELNTLTAKVLYLPHLSVIVMSEDVAKEGIDTVLDFTLRNVMIRPNITLVVANNTSAENVLRVLTPSEQISINQLDALSNMSVESFSKQVVYNLYRISGMVNTKGTDIVLNSVAVKGENVEQGQYVDNILEVESATQLQINSLAAFKSEKLVGYLDSHEAQYYNVLMGTAQNYVVNTIIDDEYRVTYEGRQTKVDIKPNIDARKVKVECKVKGTLMENMYPIDLLKPDNITTLQGYLEKQLKSDLEAVIAKTQNEFQSDILGIGSKIHQKDPDKWSTLEGYWDEIYPTLDFEVDVKLQIDSVGDIANLVE